VLLGPRRADFDKYEHSSVGINGWRATTSDPPNPLRREGIDVMESLKPGTSKSRPAYRLYFPALSLQLTRCSFGCPCPRCRLSERIPRC
jgi:hypothetical protein